MTRATYYEDLGTLTACLSWTPLREARRRADIREDIQTLEGLIELALLTAFRACWNNAISRFLMECQRRTRVAEGLSIGIERLVLRDIAWRYRGWGASSISVQIQAQDAQARYC